MADTKQDSGLMAAMARAIGRWMGNSDPSVDARAAAAQPVNQAAANMLPGAVMPHAALAEDKRRKAMIEQMMKDAAR